LISVIYTLNQVVCSKSYHAVSAGPEPH